MKGARAAGGQGAATSISPAQFFKPVEDRGVVVLLELPEEAAEERKKRGAKRRRPEEAAARTVTHEASAYQLKSASPKFR